MLFGNKFLMGTLNMPWDTEKVKEEKALTAEEAEKLALQQPAKPTIPSVMTIKTATDGRKVLNIEIPLDNVEKDIQFKQQTMESGAVKIKATLSTVGHIPREAAARVHYLNSDMTKEFGIKTDTPLRLTISLDLRDGEQVETPKFFQPLAAKAKALMNKRAKAATAAPEVETAAPEVETAVTGAS